MRKNEKAAKKPSHAIPQEAKLEHGKPLRLKTRFSRSSLLFPPGPFLDHQWRATIATLISLLPSIEYQSLYSLISLFSRMRP